MKHFLAGLFLFCAVLSAGDPPDQAARTTKPAPAKVARVAKRSKRRVVPAKTLRATPPAQGLRAAPARDLKVAQCFRVHRLLKLDSTHYWADWSNACPFTIDAVYVEVGFLDHSQAQLGEGVWPMYFVLPGVHRVTRFSVPVGVAAYETVRVSRITTDSAEALHRDRHEIQAAEHETLPAGTVPDTGIGRIIPDRPAAPVTASLNQ